MNKPITVAGKEFVDGLAELCNNSGLPAFVIRMILADFLGTLDALAEQQYKADSEKYNKETENEPN